MAQTELLIKKPVHTLKITRVKKGNLTSSICVRLVTYFQTLIEDEPEKYQSHFSEYIKKGLEPDGVEELYKKVHEAIRADPTLKKSEKQPPKEHKRYNWKKLNYEERKARLIERLNALNAAAAAGDKDDDDE